MKRLGEIGKASSFKGQDIKVPFSLSKSISKAVVGNDQWNFFLGIPSGLTIRQKVRIKLESSSAGTKWDIFQTLTSLITCGLYVASTYDKENPNFKIIEVFFLWIFLSDYLLRFYASVNRILYPFTFNAMIDLITIAPAAMDMHSIFYSDTTSSSDKEKTPTFQFLRFARILRVVRLLRAMRVSDGTSGVSAVKKQALALVLTLLSIVFISAGLIQTVETVNRDAETQGEITFGESLYFIVVTISTVGYGDYYPLTNWGKGVTMGMIVLSLVIVPMELNRLSELLGMQSKYRVSFNAITEKPHVIVIGTSSYNALLDFFTEFYHPDRVVSSENDTKCVIMGATEPSEDVRNILTRFSTNVSYIKANIMHSDDLRRVSISTASAVFILADKSTKDCVLQDRDTILRSLLLQNTGPPDLLTFAQLTMDGGSSSSGKNNSSEEHQQNSNNSTNVLLRINDMKISMLAKACLCPGLSTLVSNLFRSTNSEVPSEDWKKEYTEGASHEVYDTTLPSILNGLTFLQVTETLYKVFGGKIVLLGVYEAMSSTAASKFGESTHPSTFTGAVKDITTCIVQEEIRGTTSTSNNNTSSSSTRHSVLLNTSTTPNILINPGDEFVMHAGCVVFVLGESKLLAEQVAIESCYYEYLRAGNKLPTFNNTSSSTSSSIPIINKSNPPRIIRSREEIMIEECPFLESHIIVFADVSHFPLLTFCKALRGNNFSSSDGDDDSTIVPIVFLTPGDAVGTTRNNNVCEVLSAFSSTYVITSTNDQDGLKRAGIFKSRGVLMLADKTDMFEMDGEDLDGTTIFRYLSIQRLLSTTNSLDSFFTLVDLSSTATMKVMDKTLESRLSKTSSSSKRKRNSIVGGFVNKKEENVTSSNNTCYTQLPFYAAGYGFASDVFDTMLCQSFYTKHLVTFAESLLGMNSTNIKSSLIYQVPVPKEFNGKCYREMFTYVVRYKKVVPIGLYRKKLTSGLPYVVTSPPATCILRSSSLDFIYVLSIKKIKTLGRCQVDTSARKEAYEEIESNLATLRSVKASIEI